MSNIIIYLLGDIILATSYIFCWNRILEKRNNNIIQNIIEIALLLNIMSYFLPKPLRLIIISLLLIILNVKLLKNNIYSSVLVVIISQVIVGIAEFSFIIICSILVGNEWEKIMSEPYTFIIINTYILLFTLIVLRTRIPNKIYGLFNKSLNEKKKNGLINILIVIIIMVISTIESYENISITYVLITNIIVVAVFMMIIIKSTITNNKYSIINKKYQTSINSLQESEAMIDKFRINTHENKNELLTIRNMIKNNDKKTIEYIDKLVDNKIKDNEEIMYQTSKIPEGGLRATIYSKLCVMDKYKINYKLDIAKNVRTVDIINLDEELILNVCKILGVFLDNAIEAVKNLKKKEIEIELYVIGNELYIDITNNYKENINLSKIGHERQTTKGKEHGYGLLLVSKIVNENKQHLENEKSINGEYFTQTLIIKIK